VSQHTDGVIPIFSNLRVAGFMHRATEFITFFLNIFKKKEAFKPVLLLNITYKEFREFYVININLSVININSPCLKHAPILGISNCMIGDTSRHW
jgi:hypothetical protein